MTALEQLLQQLTKFSELSREERARVWREASARTALNEASFVELLQSICERSTAESPLEDGPLAMILARASQQLFAAATAAPLPAAATALLVDLEARMTRQPVARAEVLAMLLAGSGVAGRRAFVRALTDNPPADHRLAALALGPAFRFPREIGRDLFPDILEALSIPTLAAAVLDLANYLCRSEIAKSHPAAGRVAQLAELTGALADRLGQLQEKPQDFSKSPAELSTLVAEVVALLTSLCEALALIGDIRVTGKLHRVLALAHRRLRTEAAGALARLGDHEGVRQLANLAGEPVVRTLALSFLEQFGQAEKAAEKFRTPAARAEGALAAWAAQPLGLGVAPLSMTLVDQKTLRWPGRKEPVECFLFSLEIPGPQGVREAIGIAGPLTQAFKADLSDMPPADIYAAFAGWDAGHEEMSEQEAEELSPAELAAWAAVRTVLLTEGYQQLELAKRAEFFGETHHVARATRGGRQGTVIHDGANAEWFPTPATANPPGPDDFYNIHKGRKFLKTFNG